MPRVRAARRATVAAVLGLSLPLGAAAIPTFEMPRHDVDPAIVGAVVRAMALGVPDRRSRRMSARRTSSRRRAEAQGRASLHRWADDALAAVRAHPAEAARVHETIDREVQVCGVRPLVDASAVVCVEVALDALRVASESGGVPWRP